MDPSGHLLFDAHLPSGWESYRTYVLPWSAQPAVPPTVAVRRSSHGGVVVYASWNGATGVASWRVLGGPFAKALKPLASAARGGFETAIAVPGKGGGPYLEVQALSAQGGVLATSKPVKAPAG